MPIATHTHLVDKTRGEMVDDGTSLPTHPRCCCCPCGDLAVGERSEALSSDAAVGPTQRRPGSGRKAERCGVRTAPPSSSSFATAAAAVASTEVVKGGGCHSHRRFMVRGDGELAGDMEDSGATASSVVAVRS